jgi:hypothetical protein
MTTADDNLTDRERSLLAAERERIASAIESRADGKDFAA